MAFKGSSRLVMETHIPNGVYQVCKVCQQAIDYDHEEALRIEAAIRPFYPIPYQPPQGYGFAR